MVKTSLPPGFRFHPTDIELVKYYLKRKITGKKICFEAISEVDIYKYAPWDLPDKSCLQSGDLKWYFFCPREKKYAIGHRMNRATEFGYWKTTGKDRPVHYHNEIVGIIKTLIFHRGKAPRGDRTNWVMHEYRLEEKNLSDGDVVQDSYVLCMIFQKDGLGPKNGAQYGAPFKEEDWLSDEEDNCNEAANVSVLNLLLPTHKNNVASSSHASGSKCIGSLSESCISDIVPPTCELPQPVSANDVILENHQVSNDGDLPEKYQVSSYDDVLSMLDLLPDEDIFMVNENDKTEDPPHNLNNDGNVDKTPSCDGIDIFKDLGDLGNLADLPKDGYGFSGPYPQQQINPADDEPFLELKDLEVPLDFSTGAPGYFSDFGS